MWIIRRGVFKKIVVLMLLLLTIIDRSAENGLTETEILDKIMYSGIRSKTELDRLKQKIPENQKTTVETGIHPYLVLVCRSRNEILGPGVLVHPGVVITLGQIAIMDINGTVLKSPGDFFVLIDHTITTSTEMRPVQYISLIRLWTEEGVHTYSDNKLILVLKDKIKINNRMGLITLSNDYPKLTEDYMNKLAEGFFLSKYAMFADSGDGKYTRAEKYANLLMKPENENTTCRSSRNESDDVYFIKYPTHLSCIKAVDKDKKLLGHKLDLAAPIMYRFGCTGVLVGDMHVKKQFKAGTEVVGFYVSRFLEWGINSWINYHISLFFPNPRPKYKVAQYTGKYDVAVKANQKEEEANYYYPEYEIDKKIICSYDYEDSGNCESFNCIFVFIIVILVYRLF